MQPTHTMIPEASGRFLLTFFWLEADEVERGASLEDRYFLDQQAIVGWRVELPADCDCGTPGATPVCAFNAAMSESSGLNFRKAALLLPDGKVWSDDMPRGITDVEAWTAWCVREAVQRDLIVETDAARAAAAKTRAAGSRG